MATLKEMHDAAKGRPAGFDYLRITLAISVVVWHTIEINYGPHQAYIVSASPYRAVFFLILPMFFSLSGFLIAGSLLRCKTIPGFLFLRGIRIFPALAFEVTLSAIFLGWIYTSLKTGAYFSNHEFHIYFLNILGDIHYVLPGVFSQNPMPFKVNAQLWTIPFELKCYEAGALLGLLGLHRRRFWFLLATILAQLAMAERILAYGAIKGPVPGNVLILCFLFGVVLYLYRDRIVFSGRLALLAAAISAVLLLLPEGNYFIAAPAAYLTAYLGLLNPRRIGLLESGDYSYGVYLYGYPIQQAVAGFGVWTHQWALSLLLSAPLIALTAFCSWHFVERHALAARKLQPHLDALWLFMISPLSGAWRRLTIMPAPATARAEAPAAKE